jgi:ATP synthase protein I
MAESDPGQDPSSQDARLDSLDERLKRAQRAEAERRGRARSDPDEQYRLGNRVLSYLIGGPLGGALIGWVLDRWLGTFPWLMLILLFLGIAAGFRSIIKLSNRRPD